MFYRRCILHCNVSSDDSFDRVNETLIGLAGWLAGCLSVSFLFVCLFVFIYLFLVSCFFEIYLRDLF